MNKFLLIFIGQSLLVHAMEQSSQLQKIALQHEALASYTTEGFAREGFEREKLQVDQETLVEYTLDTVCAAAKEREQLLRELAALKATNDERDKAIEQLKMQEPNLRQNPVIIELNDEMAKLNGQLETLAKTHAKDNERVITFQNRVLIGAGIGAAAIVGTFLYKINAAKIELSNEVKKVSVIASNAQSVASETRKEVSQLKANASEVRPCLDQEKFNAAVVEGLSYALGAKLHYDSEKGIFYWHSINSKSRHDAQLIKNGEKCTMSRGKEYRRIDDHTWKPNGISHAKVYSPD